MARVEDMHWVLDEHGQPKVCRDVIEWATWYETADRTLERTVVQAEPEIVVSTVFLGLDHSFQDRAEPILWETMIFGGPHDQEQWRYCTRQEAQMGHANAVILSTLSKPTDGPDFSKPCYDKLEDSLTPEQEDGC